MATRTAENKTYYINPSSITFVENSGYGVQLIQVSASSSCYIKVYDKENGVMLDDELNVRRWKVTAYNNKFPDGDTESWFIYVRLERGGTSALVVYDKRDRAVSGGIITATTDENGNEIKETGEADPSYFYIKIGTVGATDGTSIIREINYDTGILGADGEVYAASDLLASMFIPHYDNPADPNELTWIEAKSHMGVNGGVTMYADNGKLDLPNIYEGLPIDGDTIYWGEITDEEGNIVDTVLKAKEQEFAATLGSLTNVGEWADDAPETDRIMVQKGGSSVWGPLDVTEVGTAKFENVHEDGTGNAYTAMELSEDKMVLTLRKDDTFVSTDESEQTIEGVKTFFNGIKIGERIIRESKEDVVFLDANLVVRGGITMFGTDSDSVPSILDSLPIASNLRKGIASFDGSYFTVTDGHVSLIPDSVGLNEDELKAYLEEKGTPKLSTTRTIWGQPFDGTADVDGLFTIMSSGERPFKIGWMTSEETVQLWSWKSGLGFADLCIGASKDSPSKALYFSGADGYWGIGTVTPEYNLHINGSLYAKGDVFLAENSSYRVGIRTTSPEQALDVNGGLQVASGALFKSYIYKYNSDGTYRLCFAHNVSSGLDVAHIYNISSDGKTMGDLRLGATGGVALTITAANRVGIGTAAPEKKLHVVGESAFSRSINLLGGVSNAFASEHIKFNDGGARIGANTNNDIGIYARQIYLRPASSEAASGLGVHIDNLGVTNVLGALTIEGIKISKPKDDVLYIDGNVVVRGGITMYGTDESSLPSILDSLPVASTTAKGIAQFDSSYFTVSNGAVSLIPDSVGLNEDKLSDYLKNNGAPKLTTSRTIWGQSFNGTANVKGNLKTDGNIYVTNASATTVNENSGKIKFNSINVNDMYRSPYIQAIGGQTYARKRLSIFQSNESQYSSEDGFFEALTILPNGKVGIGVTAPTNKLEVDGTLKTGGVIYGGSSIYSGGKTSTTDGVAGACLGTSGIYTISASNPFIRFFANNATAATQQITASTDYLSFSGATYHQGHLYLSGAKASSSSGNTSQLVLGTPTTQYVSISSNTGAVVINPSTSDTTGQIVLGVNGKNTSFRSSGNFGIGVNSPTYKLHVVGTMYASLAASFGSTLKVTGASTFTGKTTHNGGVNATSGDFSSTLDVTGLSTLTGGVVTTDIHGNGSALYLGNSGNSSYIYIREDMKSSSEDWSITKSGEAVFTEMTLGGLTAGDTTLSTLSVTGTSTFTGNTTNKGIAYFAGGTTYYVNASGAAKFAGITGTTGTFSSTLNVTGLATFKGDVRLKDSSNYGQYLYFGDGSYCYIAEVEDDAMTLYASNGVTVDANLLVTGGVTMYSARELKDVVDERGLTLDELSVIKPTRFRWKDGRDERMHMGGIADDVREVLPEVIYEARDGTLTMDYANAAFVIAASLINPAIEHERRIAVLEEENKKLREEINKLKSA